MEIAIQFIGNDNTTGDKKHAIIIIVNIKIPSPPHPLRCVDL